MEKNVRIESVVNAIQPTGTYDGRNGMLYKFEYKFADGSVLVANHKTNPGPFKVGDTAEYEITGGNDFGEWGNVRKPGAAQFEREGAPGQPVNNKEKDLRILYQVCIKEASMLLMGHINIEDSNDIIISKTVTGLAKQMLIDSEIIIKEVLA